MTIRFSTDPPEPGAWSRLFETAGWNVGHEANPEELGQAVQASWRIITAYSDVTLVGGGRVVSDGVLYAVLFDVIVAPQFRRQGIGREIVSRLVAEADYAGIRDVLLFAAAGSAPFYGAFGFVRRPDDAPGMLRRLPMSRPVE